MTEPTYLRTREAARRVGRSVRTIRRWRRAGMRVRIRDHVMEVELGELLSWLRRTRAANPAHQYRLRHARANARA